MPSLYLWGRDVPGPHLNTAGVPSLTSVKGWGQDWNRVRERPLSAGFHLRTRKGRGLGQKEGTLRAKAGELSLGRCQRRQVGHPGGNCAQEGGGGSEGSQTCRSPRATQGAEWGARLPPAVCGACLELVQGAEAEVRLCAKGACPS